MIRRFRSAIPAVMVCLTGVPLLRAADTNELAAGARAVLAKHCARCHGPQRAEGSLGDVLDVSALTSRRKVVAGAAAKSKLYKRMVHADDPMPPAEEKVRPSADEIAAVKAWIDAGAADWSARPQREFLSDEAVLKLIAADVQSLPAADRRFARYLTLANLYNAGEADERLKAARAAVSKLLNSLSWEGDIAVPLAVDPAGTVLRFDLRKYGWDAAGWSRIIDEYPYGLLHGGPAARAIADATGCGLAYVRADWFVATAARPPLYHELLGLPRTDAELEKRLGVDAAENIRGERVARAGFNGSGVSRNNRLIERHPAEYGAYWKSYDFAANTGRQNLFAHPVGPGAGEAGFAHDGGEIIFHLPNGLQGYLLVDAAGRRIDEGPVKIVSLRNRADPVITNGVSCMSCHVRGLIAKDDQIRASLEKNADAADPALRDKTLALHPAKERMNEHFRRDSARYVEAVAKAGAPADQADPVSALAARFEDEADLAGAAAELGLRPAGLQALVLGSPSLTDRLGTLTVAGGTVKRDALTAAFAELAGERGLTLYTGEGEIARFDGHAGAVVGVAFAPDGRRLLSAGGRDRTLRIWDADPTRESRTLAGGAAPVVGGFAVSPDGRFAATGAGDPSREATDFAIRLWNLETGDEVRRFDGHTSGVFAMAFSPDGTRLVSGAAGADGGLRIWDVETGKPLASLPGHVGGTRAAAWSPDGKFVLSAGADKSLRLWDAKTGAEVRRFAGHSAEVLTVAISPDGKFAVSGARAPDADLRLWDVATGRESRRFAGHSGTVYSAVFSPDGRQVLSGGADGTLRLWEAASGRQVTRLIGHTDWVAAVAFSPDGRRAASASADKTVRLWGLPRP